jgi:hypothetical protein
LSVGNTRKNGIPQNRLLQPAARANACPALNAPCRMPTSERERTTRATRDHTERARNRPSHPVFIRLAESHLLPPVHTPPLPCGHLAPWHIPCIHTHPPPPAHPRPAPPPPSPPHRTPTHTHSTLTPTCTNSPALHPAARPRPTPREPCSRGPDPHDFHDLRPPPLDVIYSDQTDPYRLPRHTRPQRPRDFTDLTLHSLTHLHHHSTEAAPTPRRRRRQSLAAWTTTRASSPTPRLT